MNVTPEMMGSIVTVCAELKREVGTVNDKDFAEWVSKPIKARAGWIVGVRAKKTGSPTPAFRVARKRIPCKALLGLPNPPQKKVEISC